MYGRWYPSSCWTLQRKRELYFPKMSNLCLRTAFRHVPLCLLKKMFALGKVAVMFWLHSCRINVQFHDFLSWDLKPCSVILHNLFETRSHTQHNISPIETPDWYVWSSLIGCSCHRIALKSLHDYRSDTDWALIWGCGAVWTRHYPSTPTSSRNQIRLCYSEPAAKRNGDNFYLIFHTCALREHKYIYNWMYIKMVSQTSYIDFDIAKRCLNRGTNRGSSRSLVFDVVSVVTAVTASCGYTLKVQPSSRHQRQITVHEYEYDRIVMV